jgi:phage portal protein BeeE
VIDDWGRTPQPFSAADGSMVYPPAYQQVLKGLPAVNYAARDIVYRPRNVRAHKVYGYSPVQQVLMTVNIALRRQLWQLDYFTEGSVPDALIGVPQDWTPEQIKQFQDYWDTEFVGDLAKRRRAKFVPGDSASRVHQTKEPRRRLRAASARDCRPGPSAAGRGSARPGRSRFSGARADRSAMRRSAS